MEDTLDITKSSLNGGSTVKNTHYENNKINNKRRKFLYGTFSPLETLAAPPAPDTEAKYLDHQSNLFASCLSHQNYPSIS